MCSKPEYIFLILLSTAIDYLAALGIEGASSERSKKRFLMFSLFTNLGLLFSFKYFNFVNDSVREVFQYFGYSYAVGSLDLILPIGISFYTFQTMSYTIDVYRGAIKAERHFGIFALYVSYFPQLVAGPIERATHLLPQFRTKRSFNPELLRSGLLLMLWGFIKKVVIADRLAIYVDYVYQRPQDFGGLELILATYFFCFQVYCDFSGYSDIAIGAARTMGFDLMTNFNRPYFSKSIAEFWSRWHISLSTWFRDYLYFPLGGNRVRKLLWYRNIFVVFMVSGVWHGAAWTYVVWGALQGFYMVFSDLSKCWRDKIESALFGDSGIRKLYAVLVTFNLTAFSFIFFRSNSLNDAFYIVGNLFSSWSIRFDQVPGFGVTQFALSIALIALLECAHLVQRTKNMSELVLSWPTPLRWGYYYLGVALVLLLGVFSQRQFVYFQF